MATDEPHPSETDPTPRAPGARDSTTRDSTTRDQGAADPRNEPLERGRPRSDEPRSEDPGSGGPPPAPGAVASNGGPRPADRSIGLGDGPREPRDRHFMGLALELARAAGEAGEVPIGAVLVRGDEVLAVGSNRTRVDVDPTAHAEVVALRAAARAAGEPRLPGTTLYTTVEPCFMCAGALVHARVARVVWGTRDPKFGGAVSLGRVLDDPRANHRAELVEGVRAEEAADLLRAFFRPLREGLKERRRARRRED